MTLEAMNIVAMAHKVPLTYKAYIRGCWTCCITPEFMNITSTSTYKVRVSMRDSLARSCGTLIWYQVLLSK